MDSVKRVGKKVSAVAAGGMLLAGAAGAVSELDSAADGFVDALQANVGAVTSGVQTALPVDFVDESQDVSDTADDSLSQMVDQMAKDVSDTAEPDYERLGC